MHMENPKLKTNVSRNHVKRILITNVLKDIKEQLTQKLTEGVSQINEDELVQDVESVLSDPTIRNALKHSENSFENKRSNENETSERASVFTKSYDKTIQQSPSSPSAKHIDDKNEHSDGGMDYALDELFIDGEGQMDANWNIQGKNLRHERNTSHSNQTKTSKNQKIFKNDNILKSMKAKTKIHRQHSTHHKSVSNKAHSVSRTMHKMSKSHSQKSHHSFTSTKSKLNEKSKTLFDTKGTKSSDENQLKDNEHIKQHSPTTRQKQGHGKAINTNQKVDAAQQQMFEDEETNKRDKNHLEGRLTQAAERGSINNLKQE